MLIDIVTLNAEPLRSIVPNLVSTEFPRVELDCRVSLVVSSVIVPASSKSPANLSRPPERLSSSVFREIVLPESVDNVP